MSDNDETSREEMITQFINVTSAAREFASSFLEAADWNLNDALNMYLGGGGSQAAAMASGPAGESANATAQMTPRERREREERDERLRQRAQAIMEDQGVDQATAMAIAEAQGDPPAEDNVRAPIAATTTRLIDEPMNAPFPPMGLRGNSNLRAFRTFEEEARRMEERMFDSAGINRRLRQHMSGDEQDQEENEMETEEVVHTPPITRTNLQDLFSPPQQLMFKGSWEQVREHAKDLNKWILVNVQKDSEFMSYNLNRDLWCNEIVKDLIESSFVFYQREEADAEIERYKTYYQPESYPHVAIIDPFTGEQMMSFDLARFQLNPEDLLANFLENTNQFLESNKLEGGKIKQMQEKLRQRHLRRVAEAAVAASGASVSHSIQDNRSGFVETINRVGVDADVEILDQLEDGDEAMSLHAEEEELMELEPEPVKSAESTSVQFKLFGSNTVKRRFRKDQSISDLFLFVKHEVPEARTKQFDLICFPQKSLKDLQDSTLEASKLLNTSVRAVYL